MTTFRFEKIKPSSITSDPRYQREIDEARVQEMAEDFDASMFGVPVLSERADGSKVAIDGQTRLAAAKAAGRGGLPVLCKVFVGLSLKQEAALFVRLNGSAVAVHVHDRWKARAEAHEPDVLAILECLSPLGLRVTRTKQKGGICAIKAAESVYRKGNLPAVLRVLTGWQGGSQDAYEAQFLTGMSAFLAEYPDLEEGDFTRKLRAHAPSDITNKLRQTRKALDFTARDAACVVFRNIYNDRRKKGLLPMPRRLGRDEGDDLAMAAE